MIEVIVGMVVGVVLGAYTTRRRLRRDDPPVEICQCTHSSSKHDKAGCHHVTLIYEKIIIGHEDYYGDRRAVINKKVVDRQECSCVRYVGPHTSYMPELDG